MTTIRPATREDVATILGFICELADYEREPDAVEATEASLTDALFGPSPAAEAVIVEADGAAAGCRIGSDTKHAAVARMISPSTTDLVAAAPT